MEIVNCHGALYRMSDQRFLEMLVDYRDGKSVTVANYGEQFEPFDFTSIKREEVASFLCSKYEDIISTRISRMKNPDFDKTEVIWMLVVGGEISVLSRTIGISLTLAAQRFPLREYVIALSKVGGRSSRQQFTITDRRSGEVVGVIYNNLWGIL